MLKADRANDVQKSFEKEIKFMSQLINDNIIRLLTIQNDYDGVYGE